MILTITLNPAIDRTIEVDNLKVDRVNRVKSVRRDVGGKGLNVTKTIDALKGHSKALLVLAGTNGKFIEEKSKDLGLNVEIFKILGNTRENIKIVDPVLKTYTDINEKGPVIDKAQVNDLIGYIKNLVSPEDWMVISGSAVEGITDDFYDEIFSYASDRNVRIIADVNGNGLKQIIKYKPYLIKPNIHELASLFDVEIKSIDEAIAYAKQILDEGVRVVVVSLGEEGLLWVDHYSVYKANAIKVNVKSTVGAGDAIVGGLTLGLFKNMEIPDVIKQAIAAATCVITTEGSHTGDMVDFEEYKRMIQVELLENRRINL